MKQFNQVSPCCHASIASVKIEWFPLGGKTWGIQYNAEQCHECGKVIDEEPLQSCGICGEVGCENECEVAESDVSGFSDKAAV